MTRHHPDRGQRVLDFIVEFIASHDYPPSMKDIADGCGIPSVSSVSYWLDQLERKGTIERTQGVSRSIRVLKKEQGHG